MPVSSECSQPRLLLQTMYNVRDLGGFSTKDGRITKCGRFLRADAPTQLNRNDLRLLLDFPVRAVIDLRSQNEIDDQPNSLRNRPEIDYINIPLLGTDLSRGIASVQLAESGRVTVGLADLYIHLLENSRELLGQVFIRLAEDRPGACLFHCSLGKDRTGLVSALLLMLAGVSDDDIIANYQVSEAYLKPRIDKLTLQVPEEFWHFLYTKPQNMAVTLFHFHQHYSSAEAYLAECGVSRPEIDELKNKLLN